MSRRPRVFISYTASDRDHAERLVEALLLNAVDVWYDQVDMDVGDDIHEKVQRGIIDVDYLAVVITERSLASAWVTEELGLAKQRELEERQVILLPLLFEQVTLPLHLRRRKYANFVEFKVGLKELLRTLGKTHDVLSLDQGVRKRVRDIMAVGAGNRAVAGLQEIRSQAGARLARSSALSPRHVDDVFKTDFMVEQSHAVIFVEVRRAEAEIPIDVDLAEDSRHVLARVIRALGLEDSVEEQRVTYFLLYEGVPMELDETLRDAGVQDRDRLQLGAFSYLIE